MQENKTIEFLTAILERDLALVEKLVRDGLDPSLAGPGGNTAMRNAVGSKNLQMIDLLLHLGVDINHRSYFHSGVDGRFEDHFTPLFYANYADVVDHLVAKGAAVNALNGYGETSLMRACYWTFDETIGVVESLLHAGADPEISAPLGKDSQKFTALDIARQTLKNYSRAQARDYEEDYSWQIENAKKIISILSD